MTMGKGESVRFSLWFRVDVCVLMDSTPAIQGGMQNLCLSETVKQLAQAINKIKGRRSTPAR